MSNCLLAPFEIIAVNLEPQDLEIPPPGRNTCCAWRFNLEGVFRNKVCNRHCFVMFCQAHDFLPIHNNTQPAGYQARQVTFRARNTPCDIKNMLAPRVVNIRLQIAETVVEFIKYQLRGAVSAAADFHICLQPKTDAACLRSLISSGRFDAHAFP